MTGPADTARPDRPPSATPADLLVVLLDILAAVRGQSALLAAVLGNDAAVAQAALTGGAAADTATAGPELAERRLDQQPPGPAMDLQSAAYRGMGPGDITADEDIPAMTSRAHEPLDPDRPVTLQVLLPEEHEALQWDYARVDPRPAEAV